MDSRSWFTLGVLTAEDYFLYCKRNWHSLCVRWLTMRKIRGFYALVLTEVDVLSFLPQQLLVECPDFLLFIVDLVICSYALSSKW